MTRMWGLDPELLCDQHLLGEHNEMHQAVGTILRHPHGKAIMEGRVSLEDEPDQIDTSRIQERHDNLASELAERGMNHESPMSYTDHWGLGEISLEDNVSDLKNRCDDCRERIDSNGTNYT